VIENKFSVDKTHTYQLLTILTPYTCGILQQRDPITLIKRLPSEQLEERKKGMTLRRGGQKIHMHLRSSHPPLFSLSLALSLNGLSFPLSLARTLSLSLCFLFLNPHIQLLPSLEAP